MKHYYEIIRSRFLHEFSAQRVKIFMLFAFSIILASGSFPPSMGTLKGRVIDKETKEPLAFANVVVELNGSTQGGAQSDFDGNYIIKPIPPGTYDIRGTYVGYKTVLIKGITINPDVIRFFDIEMESTAEMLSEIVVCSYSIPLISGDKAVSGSSVSKMPGRSSSSVSSTIGGVFSTDGERGCVRSSRSSQTVMYIDGIRVLGSESTSDSKSKTPKPDKETSSEESISGLIVEKFESGLLTAGEINDFSKWELWKDISANELKGYQNIWSIYPENRYCVQVINKKGFPVVGCLVKLIDDLDTVIWESVTDNTGKAEIWSELFDSISVNEKEYKIHISYGEISEIIKKPKVFKKGVNSITLKTDCKPQQNMDILFTVDATGSMGDEINYLKAELNDIIGKFSDSHPDLNIRLGSVFYRDTRDEYLTRISDFSSNIQQTIDFISLQTAGGGGDTPEAVDDALEISVNELNWNEDAMAKLMFLILDAPPHSSQNNISKLNKAIELAAKKGIKIIPVTASGIDKSTEYLMRSIALATNGTYVFLTDDSGIGGKHIKPSIDDYEVELLNDLILRLLAQYSHIIDCQEEIVVEDSTDMAKVEIPEPELELEPEILEEEVNDSLEDDVDIQQPTKNEKRKLWIKPYPNPTTGLVNIKHSKKIREIFVADMSGKILQRIENSETNLTKVDLSEYPNGMYFLKYANVDHWEYSKIILRH